MRKCCSMTSGIFRQRRPDGRSQRPTLGKWIFRRRSLTAAATAGPENKLVIATLKRCATRNPRRSLRSQGNEAIRLEILNERYRPVNNNQSITERKSSARSESSARPCVIAMLYAASRSGKQSEGCRSSLSTAGFTLMWNDARSRASFEPITLVNLSTVVLKSLACICCNSIVIAMSNNPLSHS